jgi:hypothetical protein
MRPLSVATSSIVLKGCSRPGRHSSMRLPTPRIDNGFDPGASSANAARAQARDAAGTQDQSDRFSPSLSFEHRCWPSDKCPRRPAPACCTRGFI